MQKVVDMVEGRSCDHGMRTLGEVSVLNAMKALYIMPLNDPELCLKTIGPHKHTLGLCFWIIYTLQCVIRKYGFVL
jgi:hypothetical protein